MALGLVLSRCWAASQRDRWPAGTGWPADSLVDDVVERMLVAVDTGCMVALEANEYGWLVHRSCQVPVDA